MCLLLQPNSNPFKFTKDERIFVIRRLFILKYCMVFACLINEFSRILQNDSSQYIGRDKLILHNLFWTSINLIIP